VKLNTCGHSPYATSSLTRGGVCSLQLQLVLASAVSLRSESRGTPDHILLSPSYSRLAQPGGSGARVYIPQEQGGPVILPGLGYNFVASYDSQGYGGGIRPRLHTGEIAHMAELGNLIQKTRREPSMWETSAYVVESACVMVFD
jgi:hypothetical protein